MRKAGRLQDRVLGPPLSLLRPANAVMFHIGRSGSRVLANLLGQHPRLFWDGEIYEPNHRLWTGEGDAIRLLRRRMSLAGRRIYGFEMKFFHARLVGMDFEDFFARLDDLGFTRFVVLRRRNTLRKVVSSVILHEKRGAHLRAGREAVLHRVRIDVDDVRIDRDGKPLLAYLEDYERSFERLDQLLAGRDALRLSYEDDLSADPREGYRKVCAYLGVEPRAAEIAYGKTNPFRLEEIVVNLDEVSQALRGTRFEWMVQG